MSEFIPGICWLTFRTKEPVQANAVIKAGFKMLRLFFNLRDLPYTDVPNQAYIKKCFDTMPDPYHVWTHEGKPWPTKTGEPMRCGFDFCKANKWLPIVCMGTSEENVAGEWIGRVPTNWIWLGKFVKEFAIYLHNVYGFERADLEVFNEPSKLQGLGFGYDKYCQLASILTDNWKQIPNYKVHVFADDLLRQDYLDAILRDTELIKKVDYISTHIGLGSENAEWDRGLIQIVTQKISRYPNLKQAVTEMSLSGQWSRLSQLSGVAMYGIILAIRDRDFGTATMIDDLWLYGDGADLQVTAPTKVNTITQFNINNYKPYVLEYEDMEINYVKPGSINEETRTVQQILSDSGYVLLITGKYDTDTGKSIKEFQTDNSLKADGIVGKATWDKLISETGTGPERFLQYLTRTARYI